MAECVGMLCSPALVGSYARSARGARPEPSVANMVNILPVDGEVTDIPEACFTLARPSTPTHAFFLLPRPDIVRH